MIPTLLVFSLLLHFVTFYIIIVLFQRMNHLKSQPNVDTFTDIDELLQSHLEAVKAENELLLESIDKNNRLQTKPLPKMTEPFVSHTTKPKPAQPSEQLVVPATRQSKPEKVSNKVEEPLYSPPVEEIIDRVERSNTADVLHLHEKGYSSQEIAKKLNIGKGEVEFMLNLNRKRLK